MRRRTATAGTTRTVSGRGSSPTLAGIRDCRHRRLALADDPHPHGESRLRTCLTGQASRPRWRTLSARLKKGSSPLATSTFCERTSVTHSPSKAARRPCSLSVLAFFLLLENDTGQLSLAGITVKDASLPTQLLPALIAYLLFSIFDTGNHILNAFGF